MIELMFASVDVYYYSYEIVSNSDDGKRAFSVGMLVDKYQKKVNLSKMIDIIRSVSFILMLF